LTDIILRGYWLSWYHDPEDGPFELHTPWWISGYTVDVELHHQKEVVVAAVQAESVDDAWNVVRAAYDTSPTHLEKRFCDPLEDRPGRPNIREPWTGASGRFRRADWMQWPGVEA